MPPPSITATADDIALSSTASARSRPSAACEHRVAFIMFGVTLAVCAGFIAMIVAEVL